MVRTSPSYEGTVAAIIVARGMTPALRSLLDALDKQSRLPDQLIVCDVRAPRTSPLSSGQVIVAEDLPEGALLFSAGRTRNLSDTLAKLAKDKECGQSLHGHDWLWVLHDDCEPSPNCLEEQLKAAGQGPSIAAVTPKIFRPDGTLCELGIHATSSGRRVPEVFDGEIDQGQYDGTSDVLAGGSAGLLVLAKAYSHVGGFDRALGPYNEGLELCWRLHRSGYRVVAAPDAHLTHFQLSSPRKLRTASALRIRRSSEFYFATLISSPASLIAKTLASLVWIPLTCLGLLLCGRASAAYARFFAWLGLFAHFPHILASRSRHSRCASQPRSSLRPLLTSRWDATRMRRVRRSAHLDDMQGSWKDALREKRRSDIGLRLITCVGLLVLSLWIFRSDLGGISGGAWRSLPEGFTDLWTYAWSGWLPAGDGNAHAVDPIVLIWSIVCAPFALIRISPTAVLHILLIAAPAWAAWNLDTLASRFTSNSTIRVALMCLWAAMPSALLAMMSGRMASLIVHVFLPLWFGSLHDLSRGESFMMRRSWARAAIVGAILIAAYPLLALLVLLALMRVPARASTLLPGLLLILPFLIDAALTRAWPALLVPAEAAASFQRSPYGLGAWGLPAASSLQWMGISTLVLACVWAWAVFALLRTIRQRRGEDSFPATLPLLMAGVVAAGLGALLVSHLAVDSDSSAIFGWGGALTSLQMLLLILVILSCGEDTRSASKFERLALTSVACIALIPFLVMSASAWLPLIPSDQWSARSAGTQVPLVSRYAQNSSRDARVMAINIGADGDLDVRIWREVGPAWSEHSTVASWIKLQERLNASSDAASSELSTSIATLVSFPDDATARHLALHDIDTIIVKSSGPAAASMTQTLDRAPGIEKIGETEAGSAWRVRPDGSKPARLCFAEASKDAPCAELASGVIGARTHVPGPGVMRLAERSNPHWTATLNGKRLSAAEPTNGWGQAFTIAEAGEVTLSYYSPLILAWKITCVVGAVILLAAFLRGRKDEYDNAE